MTRTCSISGEVFTIHPDELPFLERISPVALGRVLLFPPPDIAPEERQRKRLAYRNLRYLYHRQCDVTGRKLLSCYEPRSGYKVCYSEDYWGDKWDPLDYGRNFDFSRPFFEQFHELAKDVPRLHNYVVLNENCEYVNGAANCKDCYLAFNMDYCESCYYVANAVHCKSCLDSIGITRCELCYECIDCENCYNLRYSRHCSSCSDSFFVEGCRRCRSCIACANLTDKEFYIYNEKCSPQAFRDFSTRFRSREMIRGFQQESKKELLRFPRKYYMGHSNESFSGTGVHHLRHSYDCFDSFELENCRYCNYVFHADNCMDYNIFGDHSSWIYQCIATGLNAHNCAFCVGAWNGCHDNYYSVSLNACSSCFGCNGLRHQQYCILNRPYSKEDYERLLVRIYEHMVRTGEWGSFFPAAHSPFPFNETIAYEEFPLTRAEALRRGYFWKDPEVKVHAHEPRLVPDLIDQTPESICTEVLVCPETNQPFKVIAPELRFYRDLGIPVPQFSPEARHQHRLQKRLPRKLWDRSCDRCAAAIRTPYSPGRPEIVYCEACWTESVE